MLEDADDDKMHISIHAPAKGATDGDGGPAAKESISIHAPAKGATSDLLSVRCLERISIHAPAKGATLRAVYDLHYF